MKQQPNTTAYSYKTLSESCEPSSLNMALTMTQIGETLKKLFPDTLGEEPLYPNMIICGEGGFPTFGIQPFVTEHTKVMRLVGSSDVYLIALPGKGSFTVRIEDFDVTVWWQEFAADSIHYVTGLPGIEKENMVQWMAKFHINVNCY